MKMTSKFFLNLSVACLLSVTFLTLLVQQLLAGGVGASISFWDFVKAPENVVFCLLMATFIFAPWFMRGMNNRAALFCWALVLALNYVIFWWVYDFFSYQFRNVYVLNLAGLIASLPVLVIVRYRVPITLNILIMFRTFGAFSERINRYLGKIQTTDFEHNMQVILYLAFSIEFIYGTFLSVYGLSYGISYRESFFAHFVEKDHWHPYQLYIVCLNLVGVLYILNIIFYTWRDNKVSDAFGYGLDEQERREISLRLLEKYRKRTEKEKQKMRD